MIIRLADPVSEADQMIPAIKDFLGRMPYVEVIPHNETWFDDYVLELLSSDNIEVIVAEEDEEIVAGIGLLYGSMLWNPGMIQVEELFWWASPSAPARAAYSVIKEAVSRIQDEQRVGKVFVNFKTLTTSPDSVAKIYKRLGLIAVETSFVGVL